MSSVKLDSTVIEKILDKLTRLGSSFLIFGGAIILLSIIVNHISGLKLGALTLSFGLVFKLYTEFIKTFTDQIEEIELTWEKFIIITVTRFFFWFLLVALYLFLANEVI